MSNHSDLCPDCNQERRGFSLPCCDREHRRRTQELEEFAAQQTAREALLDRLGIPAVRNVHPLGWEVCPQKELLWDFLRRHDPAPSYEAQEESRPEA